MSVTGNCELDAEVVCLGLNLKPHFPTHRMGEVTMLYRSRIAYARRCGPARAAIKGAGLKKRQKWPRCKAPDAKEWLTPFQAEGNAADASATSSSVFKGSKNGRSGPDARRSTRRNGSRHFKPRATPQMGRSCRFCEFSCRGGRSALRGGCRRRDRRSRRLAGHCSAGHFHPCDQRALVRGVHGDGAGDSGHDRPPRRRS